MARNRVVSSNSKAQAVFVEIDGGAGRIDPDSDLLGVRRGGDLHQRLDDHRGVAQASEQRVGDVRAGSRPGPARWSWSCWSPEGRRGCSRRPAFKGGSILEIRGRDVVGPPVGLAGGAAAVQARQAQGEVGWRLFAGGGAVEGDGRGPGPAGGRPARRARAPSASTSGATIGNVRSTSVGRRPWKLKAATEVGLTVLAHAVDLADQPAVVGQVGAARLADVTDLVLVEDIVLRGLLGGEAPTASARPGGTRRARGYSCARWSRRRTRPWSRSRNRKCSRTGRRSRRCRSAGGSGR